MNELVRSSLGGDQADVVQEVDDQAAIGATDVTPADATGPIEYPFHDITADYSDFTKEESDALCKSVRERGLLIPVVIWQGQTVDGKHRTKACRQEGVPLRYDDITERCPTEEEMRTHVRALNEHRRAQTKPLTSVQKRERIEAALKANPERSDRQIAEGLGVNHETVSAARDRLEATGGIRQLDKRVGKDGKSRKPKSTASKNRKQPAHEPPKGGRISEVAAAALSELNDDVASRVLLFGRTELEKRDRRVMLAAWQRLDRYPDAQRFVAEAARRLRCEHHLADAVGSLPPPEKVQDGEPTLFDDLSPSLAPAASPAEKRDAAPPKPAEAPQPLDPAREHLSYILGGAGAFSHVPRDADFERMAIIIDPCERERCKEAMNMVAKIARLLLIALERSDLERPTLPPAAA
jgi:DNA-binding CsgD family transcriptional regulator